MRTLETLIRLHGCAGRFQSSLVSHVRRYVFSRCESFDGWEDTFIHAIFLISPSFGENAVPVDTWRLYNVASTSMQRHDVASTLRRRCINVMCPLGVLRDCGISGASSHIFCVSKKRCTFVLPDLLSYILLYHAQFVGCGYTVFTLSVRMSIRLLRFDFCFRGVSTIPCLLTFLVFDSVNIPSWKCNIGTQQSSVRVIWTNFGRDDQSQ